MIKNSNNIKLIIQKFKNNKENYKIVINHFFLKIHKIYLLKNKIMLFS